MGGIIVAAEFAKEGTLVALKKKAAQDVAKEIAKRSAEVETAKKALQKVTEESLSRYGGKAGLEALKDAGSIAYNKYREEIFSRGGSHGLPTVMNYRQFCEKNFPQLAERAWENSGAEKLKEALSAAKSALKETKSAAQEVVEETGKKATRGLSVALGSAFAAVDIGREERKRDAIVRGFFGGLFAQAISKNRKLEKLVIAGSEFGDEGIVKMAKALGGSESLTHLDLSSCGMGDEGARYLAKALELNTTLTYLSLRNNKVSEAGAVVLERALNGNRILKHLDLDGNSTLHLRRSKISDQTKQRIHTLLRRNKDLGREHAPILTGTRAGTEISFKVRETALHDIFQFGNLSRDQQTLIHILFDGLDPTIKTSISGEIISRREEAGFITAFPTWWQRGFEESLRTAAPNAPLPDDVLKFYIKESLLKDSGPRIAEQGVLTALAKAMNLTLHFWRPNEGGTGLIHHLSLNMGTPESDSLDFMTHAGQTHFSGVRRLIQITDNPLSPALRPEHPVVPEPMHGSGAAAGGGAGAPAGGGAARGVVGDRPGHVVEAPGVARATGEPKRYGLSIDGGGMRGLIPAIMLSRIEAQARERHGRAFNLCDAFDYVGGTSVGGILALGLTIDRGDRTPVLSCADLEGLFTTRGRSIFGLRSGPTDVHKYSTAPLNRILNEKFAHITLASTLKPVLVTSANITRAPFQPGLFNSAVESHKLWPAWQVARATSAAPKFFPAAEFPCPSRGDTLKLWDGGIWINNPSELVYKNIVHLYGTTSNRVRILSLGTGDLAAEYAPPSGHGGLQAALPLIFGQMDLAVGGVHDGMIHTLGSGYRRIQPTLTNAAGAPLKAQMDDFRPEILERYRQGVEDLEPEIAYVVEEWIRPSLEARE